MARKYRDGKKERKQRESRRFIRWSLGVDWRAPGYMIREEVKRDKMRTRARRRAWNYEEQLRNGEGSEMARGDKGKGTRRRGQRTCIRVGKRKKASKRARAENRSR